MIIAVDFDGTCVTHEFPKVGKDIGAVSVLKNMVERGHKLILFTMRSHKKEGVDDPNFPEKEMKFETDVLDDAINWFNKNDIPLWGINENPEQSSWTNSPKPYAHIYIDDTALGCPLIKGNHKKPYVHWDLVNIMLIQNGF